MTAKAETDNGTVLKQKAFPSKGDNRLETQSRHQRYGICQLYFQHGPRPDLQLQI